MIKFILNYSYINFLVEIKKLEEVCVELFVDELIKVEYKEKL